MNTKVLKKQIQYTVQLIVCVLIALEIAIPPNPYKKQLILALTILICLKHNLVERISKSLDNFGKTIKRYL
tara:strand:- start:91 stop:303 length:213 start_codon:yes stop_codon:yes gene_type:complete